MRRYRVFISILIFLIPLLSTAQLDNRIRFSTGLPVGKYGKFDHNYDFSDEINFTSFIIQAERPWIDKFGIGAYIGYSGQKHEFFNPHSKEIKHNFFRIGALLNYNLNQLIESINLNTGKNLDIYTSMKTGFSIAHSKWEDITYGSDLQPHTINDSDSNLLFDLGISLGARYHLNRDFALYSELGGGNSGLLTIGASFTH